MSTFQELQTVIQRRLAEDLEAGKSDILDAQSVLWTLGQAENENELRLLMKIYSGDHQFLADILSEQAEVAQESAELDIQKIVSRMIKDDPAKANKLAEYAVGKNLSTEDILAAFPEAKDYM